jgi:Ni2+-binding GTPase involved in maturation of urease and hydrogenase
MKLFLIGGFLGSGKTTAIQQACIELLDDNVKVAVITNDQGNRLVDTEYIRSFSILTQEVVNGCFCCNYDDLSQSISLLMEQNSPEIIFAESVGSCTDLVATIAKPLAKFHPDLDISISVFADADLLLSLEIGTSCYLDETLQYIYKKQHEESDISVINKIDVLNNDELEQIKKILQSGYNSKKILFQNSLNKDSIRKWINDLNNSDIFKNRKSIDLDYDIYGEGEARLGWMDAELSIITIDDSANEVTLLLINKIFLKITELQMPIGHLKFLIDDGTEKMKISYTTAGREEMKNLNNLKTTSAVHLLINARVQTEPGLLKEILNSTIASVAIIMNAEITTNHLAFFKPGFPKPTHRVLA